MDTMKIFIIFYFIWTAVLIETKSILLPSGAGTKVSYTSGINTIDWKNDDILTHHNDSKSIVQNDPSSNIQYVASKTEDTRRVYPIYNGHSYGPPPEKCQEFLEQMTKGPRQTALSNRVTKSLQKASCPEAFNGILPNYTDCSKFISCNNGQGISMDCAPGTLFNIKNNVCDHPQNVECFGGSTNVQFGDITYGKPCNTQGNCLQPGHTQYVTGHKVQQNYPTQYGQHTSSPCNPQTQNCQNIPSASQGTGPGSQQFYGPYTISPCDSHTHNCQNIPNASQGTGPGSQHFYGHHTISPCDPHTQNCQNIPNATRGTGSGSQHFYGHHTMSPCDPQRQNCQNIPNTSQGTGPGLQQFYGNRTISTCDPHTHNCQNIPNASQGTELGTQHFYRQHTILPCDPQTQICQNIPPGSAVQQFYGQHISTGFNQQTQNSLRTGQSTSFANNPQFRPGQGTIYPPCDARTQNCKQTTGSTQNYGNVGNAQHYPGSQFYGQDRIEITGQVPCNPQVQNCAQTFEQNSYQGISEGNHATRTFDKGTGQVNYITNFGYTLHNPGSQSQRRDQSQTSERIPNQSNCNPAYQNCESNGYVQRYPEGQVFSPGTQQTRPCDPQFKNCGQFIENGAGNVYIPSQTHPTISTLHDYGVSQNNQTEITPTQACQPTQNFQKNCNINDPYCRQSHQHTVRKRQTVQCPGGYQGITKHPFDCSKFLNCAHGITNIMECRRGTLFNPKIKDCDYPKNVDCEQQYPNRDTTRFRFYKFIFH